MYYDSYNHSKYLGLSVNRNHEFNERYLRSAHRVLSNALNEHPRTLIFHVVLRYRNAVLWVRRKYYPFY